MILSARMIREVLMVFASGKVSILHLEWIPGRSAMLGVLTAQGDRLGDLFPADLDAVLSALRLDGRLLITRDALSKIVVQRVGEELYVEKIE